MALVTSPRPRHQGLATSQGQGQGESTLLLLRLLQERATDVRRTDRDKRTALHWACGKNATPCVRQRSRSLACLLGLR